MRRVYLRTPPVPQPPPIAQDEMERARRTLEESEERVRDLLEQLDKSDRSRASTDQPKRRRIG